MIGWYDIIPHRSKGIDHVGNSEMEFVKEHSAEEDWPKLTGRTLDKAVTKVVTRPA